MQKIRIRYICLLLTCCLTMVGAQPQLQPDNIDSVINAMTLREKAELVVGAGWAAELEGLHIPFTGHHRVPGAAGETRAIERLGIPSIVLADGPAGVRMKDKGATAWPIGLSLAACNDTFLVYEVGRAMGKEAAAIGVDILLAPGMNLCVNPLCGRNYEYFSDDVARSSQTAGAIVRGLQSAGVGACVKHYAVNRQETNRMHHNELVDSALLYSTYLENFRRTIAEARPWAVMSAYNKVNGTHAQLHYELLTDVLRHQWDYRGIVMTDWKTHPEAAEKIAAGNDLLTPGANMQVRKIARAVRRGRLSEERLNEAARRMLQTIVRSHTFLQDRPAGFDTLAHRALCRRAGAAGCVWMKQPTLPAISEGQQVALLGAHSYYLIAGGTGSGFVNSERNISLSQALREEGFRIEESLQTLYETHLSKKSAYRRIEGMSIVGKYMGRPAAKEPTFTFRQLEAGISRADIAILTLGRQAGEGKDRTEDDLQLSAAERELMEAASRICRAQGKRLIVVLNTAGMLRTGDWSHLADGILMAWCPGQEGGFSILDVLTGSTPGHATLPIPE